MYNILQCRMNDNLECMTMEGTFHRDQNITF